MAVTIKETPGGTPVRARTIGSDRVQGVDAAAPPRTYFAGHEVIDLNTGGSTPHALTVPTGARFATARLVGTVDTDFAMFLFVDTPTAIDGEPVYHLEELDIASPSQFKIIKGAATSATTGGGVGTGLKLVVQYWDAAI